LLKDLQANKVFMGKVLAVHSDFRWQGLATDLTVASMDMARAEGCDYYCGCITAKGSKIAMNLGYEVLREVYYNDLRDERGQLVLGDVGEHESCAVVFKKLAP
jgi:GNAT superfamily N-acetyltransferase